MQTRHRCLLLAATVGIMTMAHSGPVNAQPKDALSRNELDQRMSTLLVDVINTGRELYIQKDFAGCYRLYQGALLTVRPLLDHRPELQKRIDLGLVDAEKASPSWKPAIDLRAVLDEVRIGLKPDDTKEKVPEAKGKEEAPPKAEEKQEPVSVTVKGTVTLDSKPLTDAVVEFVSEKDPKSKGYTGTTAAGGVFTLQDVPPGPYVVRISKTEPPGGRGGKPRELVPAMYNSQSTLTVIIPPGEGLMLPIPLRSDQGKKSP
jgi:hypothetical protein